MIIIKSKIQERIMQKTLSDSTGKVYVNGKTAEPFVKWVGGKRSLLKEILSRLPNKIDTYYEPFVGGGAVYFAIANQVKNAVLSDNNFELMITYKVIQKEPQKLIELLKTHYSKHIKNPKEYYYKIRDQETDDPIEIAGRFIYLNKTCYNGLYRVNKSGKFNVPFGRNDKPNIISEQNIMACHKALKKATLILGDFEMATPKSGDFVYIDPPYHPTSEVSFTGYTKENFTERDQARLKDFAVSLTKAGVNVMLSNSNTKFIRELYNGRKFNHSVVLSPRFVNCKPSERGAVEELLIINYQ